MADDFEMDWERTCENGIVTKRVGRSKNSGKVLTEINCDDHGREIEKIQYDDEGVFSQRVVYEYDRERKPRLVCAYDREGKLIWRQERGKRPEQFT